MVEVILILQWLQQLSRLQCWHTHGKNAFKQFFKRICLVHFFEHIKQTNTESKLRRKVFNFFNMTVVMSQIKKEVSKTVKWVDFLLHASLLWKWFWCVITRHIFCSLLGALNCLDFLLLLMFTGIHYVGCKSTHIQAIYVFTRNLEMGWLQKVQVMIQSRNGVFAL